MGGFGRSSVADMSNDTSTDESSQPGPLYLQVAREWPAVMVLGVVTIILGIVVIAWPKETLTVLSILLGIHLVIFGLFRLISAFASDNRAPGLSAVVGIIGILLGIVILRNPFETVEVLATILGVIWVITGLIDLIDAIAGTTRRGRGWQAFGGVLSLAAGVLILVWPAPTLAVIAWIAGFYLIVFGIMLCFSSWEMRRMTKS